MGTRRGWGPILTCWSRRTVPLLASAGQNRIRFVTTSIRPGHLFLNRFLIAEVIPGGGMADVFRANDQRVRRQVVIKSQRAGEEGVAFQARFQREVEVLGGVQHPFVLPLLDAGTLEDRRVWFAVPFVRDRCLRYQIEECRRAFDRAQAVQLGLDICEALQAVHDKQWVHADVKPANVLVSGRHFVLADFGIASRLDSTVLPHAEGPDRPPCLLSEPDESHPATSLRGTAEFLSPSRYEGAPATPADDCFALAVVLYQVLAGADPFDGVAGPFRYGRMLAKPPTNPRLAHPAVPEPLAGFLLRALDCTREERFRTAEEMRQSLLAASGGSWPEG